MNRKTLKKSIMTHPYSVTYSSSFNYFLCEANKVLINYNKTEYYNLSNLQQDDIKNSFKKFFNFLENDFEKKIFYMLQSKDVLLNINTLEFGDGTSINLNYNKLKYVRREIKNSNLNLRVSFNCETTSTELDFRKTKTAKMANIIHSADSYLARLLIINFNLLTIHDCFCLRFLHINLCIDFINAYFKSILISNNSICSTAGNTNYDDHSITIII